MVNPPRELMKTSRFSVPFFLHPRSDMDLTSLPSTIDDEHPKAYSDMTAGEYLDERLREIGLNKFINIFKKNKCYDSDFWVTSISSFI